MTDPATREDLEAARDRIIARIDALDAKAAADMEGWRQQQSAEHGALFGLMRSVLEGVNWIKAQWVRFTRP